LIGVIVFTFARISAACGLNMGDIFHQRVVAGHFVQFAALLVATHPQPMLLNARDPGIRRRVVNTDTDCVLP
jgi:hypothetical protein